MKRTLIIGLVLTIALGLIGCDKSLAYHASEGLEVSIQGADSTTAIVVVKTDNQTFEIDPNNLFWYYDVNEGDPEYIIVQKTLANQVRYIYLHFNINKKPPEFNK